MYDVIVVLGAAVWPGGQPSPAMRRRVLHAIALLQQGYAQTLLLTGGIGKHPPAEAEVMQRLALAQGVSGERVLLEAQATTTFESAWRCRAILEQHRYTRVLLVTDRYHLPRSLLAFRSCGIQTTGSAAPGKPARRLWKRGYYYGRESCAFLWYLVRTLPARRRSWSPNSTASTARAR